MIKIDARWLEIDVRVVQRAENSYSNDSVAASHAKVPLPQSAEHLANEVEGMIQQIVSRVEFFYGQFVTEPEPTPAISESVQGSDDPPF